MTWFRYFQHQPDNLQSQANLCTSTMEMSFCVRSHFTMLVLGISLWTVVDIVYWLCVTQLCPKKRRKKINHSRSLSFRLPKLFSDEEKFKLTSICICHLNHQKIRQHLNYFENVPIWKPKFWRTSYKWICALVAWKKTTQFKHIEY